MPDFGTFTPFIPLLALSGSGFITSASVLFAFICFCNNEARNGNARATRAAATFAVFAVFFWAVASAFIALTWPVEPEQTYATRPVPADVSNSTLWEAGAAHGIYMGGLYRELLIEEEGAQCDLALLNSQFNSVTPENALKMEHVLREDGTYDFELADFVVEWAVRRGMRVRGHALLWDAETPYILRKRVVKARDRRREATDIIETHIRTVVGRYAGRIRTWDVVNEPMDGGEWGSSGDAFYGKGELGVDYIEVALRAAHAVDPNATLFINEGFGGGYDAEDAKVVGFLALLDYLLQREVPLHGVGIQAHGVLSVHAPDDDNQGALRLMREVEARGLAVEVTEFDARLRIFSDLYPREDAYAKQGKYYADWVTACLQVQACQGFTTWGVTDGTAWYEWLYVYQWMRVNDPLWWDSEKRSKPAFVDTIRALRNHSGPPHTDPASIPAPRLVDVGDAGHANCTDFRRVSTATWAVLGLLFYSAPLALALGVLYCCCVTRRPWDRLPEARRHETAEQTYPAMDHGTAVAGRHRGEADLNDVELTTREVEPSATS